MNENWGENRGGAWLEKNNIQKQNYRNGELDGNACKKILLKLDQLRSQVPRRLARFVDALEAFNKVREACFSQELDPGFKIYISNFEKAYKKLGVPMTNKVHILVAHVPDFCERNGMGLGFFSEQARYKQKVFTVIY